jgi:hypothetical protein
MRFLAVVLALGLATACSSPFSRQYEYEERLYLDVDGSASVTINASIPALVALRGLSLDPAIDREALRALVEHAGCPGARVGRPWTRRGRRFVQIRLTTDDVRRLNQCTLFAWSSYSFEVEQGSIRFTQDVGPPAAGDPGSVNWDGREVVGFKLHLPSRIVFHNVKRLEDGANGEAERGNILAWEQYLSDRRTGRPLRMEVRMGSESILFHAVRLFLGALVAAVVVMAGAVWLIIRRARRRLRQT